jgi:mono/diheme cytochrome c family protein
MKQLPFPLTIAATLALALGLAGCQKKEEGAPAGAPGQARAEITEASRAEAKEIFATRCTPCHGPTGEGDGPASAGLSPPPRNLRAPEWQSSVTDEHIERIIEYGGAAVGRSPGMPPNPDLAGKPVVLALREYVRNLEQK